MRIFTKELLPQNPNHVARPSVKIIVTRYYPRHRRYSVVSWSGWPNEREVYAVDGTNKQKALEAAARLVEKYRR